MIKTKVIALALGAAISGSVAIGSVVLIKNEIHSNTVKSVQYLNSSSKEMDKAASTINIEKGIIQKQNVEMEKLNKEISNQNKEIKNKNALINELTQDLAYQKSDKHFKDLTFEKKEQLIVDIMKNWGYSKASITLVKEAFKITEGHFPWFQKNTKENKTIVNSSEDKTIVSNPKNNRIVNNSSNTIEKVTVEKTNIQMKNDVAKREAINKA